MGMRIFVLGHRGMLGHVVARYLQESGMQVVTSDERYTGLAGDLLLRQVRESGAAWVMNAIGLIKQKSITPADLYRLNTVLPIHLLQELDPEQRLLHASTDCVFSGREGCYAPEARRDPDDDYGLSKALGEVVALDPRATVFRVSIIGPDHGEGKGLFGWFMTQKGTVRGYTNHFWNGITTLEWAKAAVEIISGKAPAGGLKQLGVAKAVSKHELLRMINEIWSRNVLIEPGEAESPVDRTLVPAWVRAPLRDQLLELKSWSSTALRHD